MTPAQATIRMLQAGVVTASAHEWRLRAARVAWVSQAVAKLRAAHHAMDERCTAAVERLDAEAFERLVEAEQAKIDAIRAPIDAVIERDLRPRELYWSL